MYLLIYLCVLLEVFKYMLVMSFAVCLCELGLQSLLWILCILHDTLIKVLSVV